MYLYPYDIIRICVPCEHGTYNIGTVRMRILAIILMFCILCIYEWALVHTHMLLCMHPFMHTHARARMRTHTHTHTHTQFFVLVLYMF